MTKPRIDLAPFLPEAGTFPYPDWVRLSEAITAGVPISEHQVAWTDAGRQWLVAVATEIGGGYSVHETKHFLLLLPDDPVFTPLLMSEAEHFRSMILNLLPSVTQFNPPGKQIVLVFPNIDWYYSYTSHFYPDHGEYGGSGGMFLRDGCPHTALYMTSTGHNLVPTFAHEMTHEGLSHLSLPAWLEEGVTQFIEHGVTPGGGFALTGEKLREHQWYWPKHGLGAFWWGQGYHRAGRVQSLCYDLSNVLFHILAEEFRPPWFGLFGNSSAAEAFGVFPGG
jgi:hypothetical protein